MTGGLLEAWGEVRQVGLRSAYLVSLRAAPLVIRRQGDMAASLPRLFDQ